MTGNMDNILDKVQAELNALETQIKKLRHEQEFEEFFGMAAVKFRRGSGRGRAAKPESATQQKRNSIPLFLPEPRPDPQLPPTNAVLTSRYLLGNVLKPDSAVAPALVEIARQEEATAACAEADDDDDGTCTTTEAAVFGLPLLSTIPVSNKSKIKMKDTGEVLECVIGWYSHTYCDPKSC